MITERRSQKKKKKTEVFVVKGKVFMLQASKQNKVIIINLILIIKRYNKIKTDKKINKIQNKNR